MPPRDLRVILFDIQKAGDRVIELTGGSSLEQYKTDWVMRAAIERQFEIIGEALNRALTIDESVEERITDIRKIVAFRHQIIHGYDVIDHDIVWGVIERYLPPLMREVNTLLGELDG